MAGGSTLDPDNLGDGAPQNGAGTMTVIFSDCDLRRTLDKSIDVHTTPMRDVMTRDGRTIQPDQLAAEALNVMEGLKINALPVLDESGALVGAINMHDLLRAGVI